MPGALDNHDFRYYEANNATTTSSTARLRLTHPNILASRNQEVHTYCGKDKPQDSAYFKPDTPVSFGLQQCVYWPTRLLRRSSSKNQRQLLPASTVFAASSKHLSQLAMSTRTLAAAAEPVLTFRALAAGLLVGAVLCFSNTYFGLQTGWVTMGSLQSAILGYGLFQGLGAAGLLSRHFSAAENVIVQTTAVATATMPLAAGLVGIIPALGLLTPDEHPAGPITFTPVQLLAWCSALAFFGVFVAVPLRQQTIIREKLRFPSGTATASVIRTLHGLPPQLESEEGSADSSGSGGVSGSSCGPAAAAGMKVRASDEVAGGRATCGTQQPEQLDGQSGQGNMLGTGSSSGQGLSHVDLEVAVWAEGDPEQSTLLGGLPAQPPATGAKPHQQQLQWARALRLLLWTFALAGAYSLAAAWVKPLKVLKVFDWLHLPAATAWGWVLQPSAGYIGQGMIMGPKTAWSMMAGAITGWALLGPMALAKGWAPGPIKDVETGAAGWLMWLGLALLLGDCFSELALLLGNSLYDKAVQSGWLRSSPAPRGRTGATQGLMAQVAGAAYQQLGSSADGSSSLQQQQQQQQCGLRSRAGSRSAAAGSDLELSWGSNSSSRPASEHGCGPEADGALGQGKVTPEGVVTLQVTDDAGEALQLPGLEQRGQPGMLVTDSASAPHTQRPAAAAYPSAEAAPDVHAWLMSASFWVPGLLASTALATAVLSPMLGMPWYEPLVAVLVALLVALLAVRALGQTDLNPVSGVGKVSQLVFAVVSPGAVLPNLVAGAIAEAGAQQAGDLMQDFKTAHLLGVPPSSQLVAMLLGSAASVPLSVAAYLLYTHAWQVPGPDLPAPTAQIWLDMAKLVNGGRLPDHIGPFCAAAAAIAAALPVLQLLLRQLQRRQARHKKPTLRSQGEGLRPMRHQPSALQQAGARLWSSWRQRSVVDRVLALLPSGVGFAVGCYLTPNWTLPRLIGSVAEQLWLLFSPDSHAAFMMVTASGLVLGEGCASVVTAVVQAVIK